MLASAASKDVGAVRLDDDGKLVIRPLSAEDIPPRPAIIARVPLFPASEELLGALCQFPDHVAR